jgi:hypothetical protein
MHNLSFILMAIRLPSSNGMTLSDELTLSYGVKPYVGISLNEIIESQGGGAQLCRFSGF